MDSPENPTPAEQPVTPAAESLPPAVANEPQTLAAWIAHNRVGLTLIFGVIAFILVRWGLAGLINAFIVGIGLSFIIFIHELGHFAVAKWCDVHVETFSIGFGPPLPGCWFQRGETTYMLAMVPLGGYVKMVGENPENDEDETDPRSFKNKAVWQRMAIISAGVIMNLIFGCLAFITVFMLRGDMTIPGVVGQVEAGGAAWVKRTQSGDIIYEIGDKKNPTFEEVRIQSILSQEGEKLPYVIGQPGQKKIETTIEPIRTQQEGRPVIGMHGPISLQLAARADVLDADIKGPTYPGLAAARAEPPFEFGDLIVGSSYDPNDITQIKPLPMDPRPRGDHRQVPDYYEFQRRQIDLASKHMMVQVRRQKPDGMAATVDIKVPPQFTQTVGLRMQMGHVVAVQDDSPAARSKIQARDGTVEGDRITEIEVEDAQGGKLRWVLASDAKAPDGVTLKVIDPMRLPFELAEWAYSVPPEQRTVTLTLLREKRHNEPIQVVLEWDSAERYSRPVIRSLLAPVAIPELGLAYQVETTVASVVPGSPATRARKEDGSTVALKSEDVVAAYWFFKKGKDGQPVKDRMEVLKSTSSFLFWTWKEESIREAWPSIFIGMQDQEVKQLGLRIERAGEKFDVVLDTVEDTAWSRSQRGLAYTPETQTVKADSIGQAMGWGFDRTYNFVVSIYIQLERLVSNRISFNQHATGPIGIARIALSVAESDGYQFLLFLAMISVNLAVINFLPIPVLDGGHMVFLIYEGLRGKPAPEWVRLATTYAGLAMIASLMLYVIYLDVSRLLS